MKGKKRVTINDVAREAGVAPSTVSYVMNNSNYVSPETKTAVLAAIEKLNYRPNVVAQGLARGRFMAIGVLTDDFASQYHAEVFHGIEETLFLNGYYPIVISTHLQTYDHIDVFALLMERGVEGMLFLQGPISADRLREASTQLPLIIIHEIIEGLENNCLLVDNFSGAYQAVQHLISLGHTRIAHIRGIPNHDTEQRYQGYSQALNEANIEVNPDLIVEGDFSSISGLRATEELFRRGVEFTAIFAGNDEMAYGALQALTNRGLRVPTKISLIGYDDKVQMPFGAIELTTVRQPIRTIGSVAAQAVVDLIEGREMKLPILPTELVIRNSTAPVK